MKLETIKQRPKACRIVARSDTILNAINSGKRDSSTMAAIMTGTHGTLAYWDAAPATDCGRAFGPRGDFHKPQLISFARLSAFAANGNHAPSECDGAVTWDAGLDLLFRIAGRR
jgi:hypothetical protein